MIQYVYYGTVLMYIIHVCYNICFYTFKFLKNAKSGITLLEFALTHSLVSSIFKKRLNWLRKNTKWYKLQPFLFRGHLNSLYKRQMSL